MVKQDDVFKVFITPKKEREKILSQLDENFSSKSIIADSCVLLSYGYSVPNEYINLLNTASDIGLKQLLITPYRYKKLMESLASCNYNIKSISFDPELDSEDADYINDLLNQVRRSFDKFVEIEKIKNEISSLDQSSYCIPQKMSFSKYGNEYTIQNNGVLFMEDIEGLSDLAPILNDMVDEV